MLDRTIPFYNTILRCDEYTHQPVVLTEGYRIEAYCAGREKDWARLECAIGDFDSVQEAEAYFMEKYVGGDWDDILFLLNPEGNVIGSCIAWTDERRGLPVNSLHWLVVDEAYHRRGFGRALCVATMNRFFRRDGKPIYIHTQPWSWKAILLYCSLGFRLQQSDTFAAYVNQYSDALQTLNNILPQEQMQKLCAHSQR